MENQIIDTQPEPQLLGGPLAFRPETAVPNSIYHSNDTDQMFRFENGSWKEINLPGLAQ